MKWKLLIALFLVANFSLFAHPNDNGNQAVSVFDQLVQLNKHWASKQNDFPNLQTPQKFDTHTDLISFHLGLVENELRENPPKNLTEKQIANREKGLDILEIYQQAGKFPVNNHHSYTLPYFIDDFNTACAVGHIIRESGSADLAHKIAKEANYAFIENMHFPELPKWAKEMGFTVEELKWIQPTYSPAIGITLENTINPDCNEPNGTLNVLLTYVSVAEANSSVSFEWIEGSDFNNAPVISTQEDLTNVSAGFYCLRVNVESTDPIMSPGPYTFCYELDNQSGPNVFSEITNQNCPNSQDGAISLEILGNSPYTIEWYDFQGNLIASDVQTLGNLSGNSPFDILLGGPAPTYNYYAIVTDEVGCKTVETFFVSVNSDGPYISQFGNEVTNATCSEGGSIVLQSHVGDLYWEDSFISTFTESERNDLAPGTYTVVATDSFGCEINESFEIGFDNCTDPTLVSVCSGSDFTFTWEEFGDEQGVSIYQNASNGTGDLEYFNSQFGGIGATFTYTPDPNFIGADTVVVMINDLVDGYGGAIQWVFNIEDCGETCFVDDPFALAWLQEIIDNSGGCNVYRVSQFEVSGSSYFAVSPHPGGTVGITPCPTDGPVRYYDCTGDLLCSVGFSPFPPDCPDGIIGGNGNSEIIWTYAEGCIDPSQVDPFINCTEQYDPVCGCDGNTYSNDCVATSSGVLSFTQGACGVSQQICAEDPTQTTWFQNLIDDADCCFTNTITQYSYDGGYYILIGKDYDASFSDCPIDSEDALVDCEGLLICSGSGGELGNNCFVEYGLGTLPSTIIWECNSVECDASAGEITNDPTICGFGALVLANNGNNPGNFEYVYAIVEQTGAFTILPDAAAYEFDVCYYGISYDPLFPPNFNAPNFDAFIASNGCFDVTPCFEINYLSAPEFNITSPPVCLEGDSLFSVGVTATGGSGSYIIGQDYTGTDVIGTDNVEAFITFAFGENFYDIYVTDAETGCGNDYVIPFEVPACGDQGCNCSDDYNPVCGVDGITYNNFCFANCAGVEVAATGECPTGCICTQEYAPVCGDNGLTYTNACLAECDGVTTYSNSACSPNDQLIVLISETTCNGDGTFSFTVSVSGGSGSYGVYESYSSPPTFYNLNQQPSVTVTGNIGDAVNGIYTFYVYDEFIADVAAATHTIDISNCSGDCICPAVYAPVCGVDGVTYGNSCAAACAGVQIASQGECNTNSCAIENPLEELPWLQNLVTDFFVDGFNCECGYVLNYTCYNGEGVFVLGPGPNATITCNDIQTFVYDVNGEIICIDGGFTGGDCFDLDPTLFDNLGEPNIIYTCEDACATTFLGEIVEIDNDCFTGLGILVYNGSINGYIYNTNLSSLPYVLGDFIRFNTYIPEQNPMLCPDGETSLTYVEIICDKYAECYDQDYEAFFYTVNCSDFYEPVCGCDNVTYSNSCIAGSNGITSYTSGECNKKTYTICPGDSVQIGLDGGLGNTILTWTPTNDLSCTGCFNPYASPSVTTTYQLEIFTTIGETTDILYYEVIVDEDCEPNYCGCSHELNNPVCDINGITYANTCLAECAGAVINDSFDECILELYTFTICLGDSIILPQPTVGPLPEPVGNALSDWYPTTNLICAELVGPTSNQNSCGFVFVYPTETTIYTQKVRNSLNPDTTQYFIISYEIIVDQNCNGCNCDDVYEPVCGLDGVTYDNACQAECEGVQYSQGSCCVDPCGGLNPSVNLPWLKNNIDNSFGICSVVRFQQNEDWYYYITNNQEPLIADQSRGTIYDCAGNYICSNGGFTVIDNQCGFQGFSLSVLNNGELVYDGGCTYPPTLPQLVQTAPNCNACICPAVAAPVCGVNGVTYGNSCEAACADVEIASEGFCQPCTCDAVYEPVCGVNGVTYANTCEAECAGIEIESEGECSNECLCPPFSEPVCGEDGVTYINACEAECAGTQVAYTGSCNDCNCDNVYEPVCGINNVTYANACEAECAGAKIACQGPCLPETICGLTDPINELEWLKFIINDPCYIAIHHLNNLGQDFFFAQVSNDCAALDAASIVLDCEGNTICNVGGFTPIEFQCVSQNPFFENINLTDCNQIWEQDPCICSVLNIPVCGVDGNTYTNECEANCAGVEIDYLGECQNNNCDDLSITVEEGCSGPCGCDNTILMSATGGDGDYTFTADNGQVVFDGMNYNDYTGSYPIAITATDGSGCSITSEPRELGFLCCDVAPCYQYNSLLVTCELNGIATLEVILFEGSLDCGYEIVDQNGNQYQHGDTIPDGFYIFEFYNLYCNLEGTTQIAVDCFASCDCPDVSDPVCGVDGNTYDNPCLAECAGVMVASLEPCDGGGITPGCTDPCASNFNALATVDDGSCEAYNTICPLVECVVLEWNPATCSCEFPPELDCNDNDDCTEDYFDYLMCGCVNEPIDDCGIIFGCTDPCADNFNPNASEDDGSCNTYDTNCDDGCQYTNDIYDYVSCQCVHTSVSHSVCNDNDICTEDIFNDETCECSNITIPDCGDIIGCLDPCAANYNPDANVNDGSCIPYDTVCDDGCQYTNDIYDFVSCQCVHTDVSHSVCDDDDDCTEDIFDAETCECIYLAFPCGAEPCGDPLACNYDPSANANLTSNCAYGDLTCPDPCNVTYGCTNPLAFNYDANANCDDNSCSTECNCSQEYLPVCGSNGMTYSNSCFAECDGITEYEDGSCSTLCDFGNLFTSEYIESIGTDDEPQSYAADIYCFQESLGIDNICGWNWDFGNGTTSTDSDPCDISFATLENGEPVTDPYLVCLTVTDCNGFELGTCCENIYPSTPPVNPCTDLAGVDFGECEALLGAAVVNGSCQYLSGCGTTVDGVDYSPYIFTNLQVCIESCIDGETSNFPTFPWLDDIVDVENCCGNTTVAQYSTPGYSFIYIKIGDGCDGLTQLYLTDGTLYCTSASNFDCYDVYKLNLFTETVLFTCDNGPDCNCPDNFDPVCGEDGITYDNACVAACLGVTCKDGACGPKACADYITVTDAECGASNGTVSISFASADQGHLFELTLPDGTTMVDFTYTIPDFIDDLAPGNYTLTITGELVCESIFDFSVGNICPCNCPDVYNPVCGTNGITYSNECEAECDGAIVDYSGTCTDYSSDTTLACLLPNQTGTYCPTILDGYSIASYHSFFPACSVELIDGCLEYHAFPSEYSDYLEAVICNDEMDCYRVVYQITITNECIIEPYDCEVQEACTEAITPIIICPEFCGFADQNYSIQDVHSFYTACSISILDDFCFRYIPLPQMENYGVPDSISVVACSPIGLCDTISYIMSVGGCNDGGRLDQSEELANTEFDVYPNPNNGLFYIDLVRESLEAQTVSVYDITGKLLKTYTVSAESSVNNIQVDMTDVSSGMYFVEWRTETQLSTERIIIE